jgi:hypothetical protein
MSIDQLKLQMSALKESGPPDLQLSESAHREYTGLIHTYRSELKAQRDKAISLANLGNVGNWGSAQQTRAELVLGVSGPKGIVTILDKYLTYLDEFEATVDAAYKRMQAEDQAG